MESKELTKDEEEILFKALDEYRQYGTILQTCPRCNGKLKYRGNREVTSYDIFCENVAKCGVTYVIRGL